MTQYRYRELSDKKENKNKYGKNYYWNILKENKEKLKEYQKEYKLNWYQSMSEEERQKIKEFIKKCMKKYKKS